MFSASLASSNLKWHLRGLHFYLLFQKFTSTFWLTSSFLSTFSFSWHHRLGLLLLVVCGTTLQTRWGCHLWRFPLKRQSWYQPRHIRQHDTWLTLIPIIFLIHGSSPRPTRRRCMTQKNLNPSRPSLFLTVQPQFWDGGTCTIVFQLSFLE